MVFAKIFSKRKSVVFTWLLSYALVLIIPVIISGATYIESSKVLENEINNSNKLSLKKIQNQMDAILGDAQRLIDEMSLNSQIRDLLNVTLPAKEISGYDIYRTVKDLSSYKISNSSIDDFYIYFKNSDLVVSSNTGKDSQSFYDIYIASTGVPYEQWHSMISEQYRTNYITSYTANIRGKSNKTVVLLKTIPLNVQGNQSATIVITLDEARFMEDVKDIESISKGSVLILSSDNKIMAASQSAQNIGSLTYEDLKNQSGMMHRMMDGKRVVVSYTTSQIASWKFVSLVPYSVFWEKADYIRRLTFIALALCLVVGSFVTVISLKKNYNPVSRLVKLLEKDQGMNFDKMNNEYLFIQQVIDKIQLDKLKTDTILQQQNRELKAGLLTRLLKGRVGGNLPIQDALTLHDIHFKSDYFAVMVLYIEDYTEVFSKESAYQDPKGDFEKFKMVQFIVTNVVEEMVGQKNNVGYMTDVDDMLVCLVNFSEEEVGGRKEEMTRVTQESNAFLSKHFNINCMVAISNIHKTQAGIPEAYSEALQTLEYKKVLGIEEIIHYQDIIGMPKGDYYYPLEIEQQLINSIKIGDIENSKQILEDIFSKNFQKSILSLEISRCLVFDLVSTMIKTVNDTNGFFNSELLKDLKPVEKLLNCKSISDMKREMIGILNVFCDYFKKTRSKGKNKSADQQLVMDVTKFVRENYVDPDLGVTMIAEKFSTHIVHLSKAFKEQTDEGLADYITKVRLKKAKELLKEMNNIEEVSKAVGYSNIRTFMRAFKKVEGITPGKFKGLE